MHQMRDFEKSNILKPKKMKKEEPKYAKHDFGGRQKEFFIKPDCASHFRDRTQHNNAA